MALDTYAKLEQAVKDWMHRDSIRGVSQGASVIETLIEMGEKQINREIRHRHMETVLTSATAAGVIAVPSDYVELKHAYIDLTTVQWLRRADPTYIYLNFPLRAAAGSSIPTYIGRDAGNFVFGPFPDIIYNVRLVYYRRFTALITATNALFLAFPDLYLFAALTQARGYVEDVELLALWDAAYTKVKDQVAAENANENRGGSALIADSVPGNRLTADRGNLPLRAVQV